MFQESRPAFDAGSLRGVERLPLGTDRPAAQADAGLVRSPVPFAGVAPLAGGHAVGPARRSPLRPGQYVVDGDRLGPWLRAAVLADVVVALGDVAPAEHDGRVRQAIVVRQGDDLGYRQPQPCKSDARLAVG